jgi:hypothetical protein
MSSPANVGSVCLVVLKKVVLPLELVASTTEITGTT